MYYRPRYRYGSSRVHPAAVAGVAVLVFAAVGVTQRGTVFPARASTHAATRPAAVSGAAAQAVAYAEARVGWVPYVYGGATDAGLDCSALVMNAWASAGITIARTSEDQWATERHVTAPEAGDDVFFAGADGTAADPGHVGIVTDPAEHRMVDAYGSGTDVRYDTYGLPSSAPGLSDPVGFTDPGGA